MHMMHIFNSNIFIYILKIYGIKRKIKTVKFVVVFFLLSTYILSAICHMENNKIYQIYKA